VRVRGRQIRSAPAPTLNPHCGLGPIFPDEPCFHDGTGVRSLDEGDVGGIQYRAAGRSAVAVDQPNGGDVSTLTMQDIDWRGRGLLTDCRSAIGSDNDGGRPAHSVARRTASSERTEVAAAFAVLAIHVAGPDGWCLGCESLWARLAPAPMPRSGTGHRRRGDRRGD
jgi:hypothetical protein